MATKPAWGAAAYTGQQAVLRERAPNAKDFTQTKAARHRPLTGKEHGANRTKSRVRANVEHPFLVMKHLFGLMKVRYRGLAKNAQRLFVTCALVNLFLARRHVRRTG